MTRKPILILIGLIALSPALLNAQGRGGGGRGGGHAGMRGGPPAGTPVVSAPAQNGGRATAPFSPGRGPGMGARGYGPGNVNPYFHGARGVTPVVGPVYGYPSYGYGYSPYYSYPSTVWPAPVPDYGVPPVEYSAPPTEPVVIYQNPQALEDEVSRLTDEVRQLRAEEAARLPQPPIHAELSPVHTTPTVLVYKNGQREEVQGYAIVEQTVWIFEGNGSRRISLANLDLEKTENENRQRGLRFAVPGR